MPSVILFLEPGIYFGSLRSCLCPLPTPAQLIFPLDFISYLCAAERTETWALEFNSCDFGEVVLFHYNAISSSALCMRLTIAPTSLVLCWFSYPLFPFFSPQNLFSRFSHLPAAFIQWEALVRDLYT